MNVRNTCITPTHTFTQLFFHIVSLSLWIWFKHYFMSLFLLFFLFTNILLVHTKYLVGVSKLFHSLYFDVLLFSISFLVWLMYFWNCVNEWDASHSTNRILLIPMGLENGIAEPNRTESSLTYSIFSSCIFIVFSTNLHVV